MTEKETRCPCPDTRNLSKEERLNALIEAQCLQYKAISEGWDYHFKNKKDSL